MTPNVSKLASACRSGKGPLCPSDPGDVVRRLEAGGHLTGIERRWAERCAEDVTDVEELRRRCGLTVEGFAYGLCRSPAYVSQVLAGRVETSVEVLARARVLSAGIRVVLDATRASAQAICEVRSRS